MASAFSVFRKHERWMMAVVGVMAMIAFVFFDPIFGARSGTRGTDPVIAETTLYGDIRASDMQRMMGARALANRFVQMAMQMGYGYSMESPFGPDTENGVVETMLKSRKAEQMGMRVTDEEVTRFLQLASGDRVNSEGFATLLKQLQAGRQGAISRRQLYDAIRTELLSQKLSQAFAGSLQTTPAERWDYYQRLNSRADITAVPVAVADFLEKVPDPDEPTVAKFFETYKDVEASPGAPTPGFKVPAKVELQYFVASYEQFEDPDAVTYAEIVDEYNKNKDTRYLYSGDFNLSGLLGGGIDATPKSDETPGEEKRATESAPARDAPATDPAPSEPAATEPAPTEPATPPETPAAPPADAPATPAEPPATPPEAAPAAPAPPQAQLDKHGLTGTELALAIQDPPAAATDAAAPAQPAAPAAAEAAAPADATAPAEEAAKREEPKLMTLNDEYALPRDTNPPQYDSLRKVELDIRAELARRAAAQRMETVLQQLKERMTKYGSDRTRWEVKREKDKTLKEPVPLDLDALAAEFKVTPHTTKLLSGYELSEVPGLGESFIGQNSFVAYAFSQWPTYQPTTSLDSEGNQYLTWKINQQESRVPALAEVRDEVVRAWKMIEARKPALEHAKKLVEQVRKDNVPLADVAKRDSLGVVTPPAFSWLTYGTTPNINNRMPPRLSEVQGIEDVGNDFMQTVFAEAPGDVSVAFNNPQTVAYVVQVVSFDPGVEVLRRSFLADDYRTYERVATPDHQRKYMSWNSSIEQEAGLKWVQKPVLGEGEAASGD